MKGKRELLYSAGVLLVLGVVAILVVNAASSKPVADIKPKPQWVYSAKFVCGIASDLPGTPPIPAPVAMGDYRTAINVHNPQGEAVKFTKKVVQALSEDIPPIRPSDKIPFGLESDFAIEIDCTDIFKIGHIPSGTFAKGFVVITTPEPLDVIGVYTSMGTTNPATLDVEEVTPKLIKQADP